MRAFLFTLFFLLGVTLMAIAQTTPAKAPELKVIATPCPFGKMTSALIKTVPTPFCRRDTDVFTVGAPGLKAGLQFEQFSRNGIHRIPRKSGLSIDGNGKREDTHESGTLAETVMLLDHQPLQRLARSRRAPEDQSPDSGGGILINHNNLEEFSDPINYDREDTSDTGIAFYTALAQETGSPVLELACGTGRVSIPIAQLGRLSIACTGRCSGCDEKRIAGTRMTRMTRIISDKTKKVQRQSALSVSSAFYQPVR